MHIHILGICGTFMGGVAALARAAGHRVTGTDTGVYPPMSSQLDRLGIHVHESYDAAFLGLSPDCVVIGNALSRGNASVEAALNSGLPYFSGPEWLAQHVLRDKHVLAVAGTHGKTTTASLLAWILEKAGQSPGFLIGGVPENFGTTARFGDSGLFVVEADEYDTAFFDKRAKFVHYRPRTAVLTNLEFDHADIYDDIDAILWQFHQLLRTVPGKGTVIVNGADQNLRRLLEIGCWSSVETFGLTGETDWRAEFSDGNTDRVRVIRKDLEAQANWQLTGSHNLENALAAVAAAGAAGVELADAVGALESFRGVTRRLQRTAVAAGVSIYDDFAHHPTAIRRTIEGMRSRIRGARLIVALEPRSNTMKLGAHNATLGKALREADQVVMYAPPEQEQLVSAVRQDLGGRLQHCSGYEDLVSCLLERVRPGDHVVFMSNGGFGGAREELTQLLQGNDARHR